MVKKSFTICLDILTQTTNGTDSPTCIVIIIAFTAFGHMLHGNNMRICTVLQDPITHLPVNNIYNINAVT